MDTHTNTPVVTVDPFLAEENDAEKEVYKRHGSARTKLARSLKAETTALLVGIYGAPTEVDALMQALTHITGVIGIAVAHLPEFPGLDILCIASSALEDGALAVAAQKLGILPVVSREVAPLSAVSDYDAQHEVGSGFLTRDATAFGLFAGVVRAAETHRFPDDFRYLVKNAIAAGHATKA